MWVKTLKIKEFRAFQEEFTMELAKNITCISGHNGIGKSTILAILGNCGEIKAGEGRMLDGSVFRGEFADVIKGDKDYDDSGEKVTIEFESLPTHEFTPPYVDTLDFRTTFQESQGKERFRLIPKKIPGQRNSEAKINWPTFYLGLSRLYPIGESKDIRKSKHLSDEIAQTLIETHASILSMNYGEEATAKELGIIEHSKSKVGVKTQSFSETANSSGQDNIGQILLAVFSFENLKSTNSNYSGGLLLIDELDATLHPAVQKRLFDYLLRKSIELDLQIVFTTHSLSLIEHVSYMRSKRRNLNLIKLSYLRKRERSVNEVVNPNPSVYQRDLNDTYAGLEPKINKVKVITEDDVAKWFLENILSIGYNGDETFSNIEYLDLNTSWQHIVKLMVCDVQVYKNYIAVLDPDINKDENLSVLQNKITGYPYKINQRTANFLTIPSSNPNHYNVERMFWEYLSEVEDDHDMFDDEILIEANFQKRLLLENGPDSERYARDGSMKYKNWFQNHQYLLNTVLRYWAKDNQDIVMEFVHNFKSTYNKINKEINP
ncbi:AAA family ATPase [Exiguobacterium sp. AT1b]|uniref:ATP-dependent nuclease n=1 Tax=Exiguobacterium sp. (strain ATCC BAA-1283 / AT1b) TaxID=360911 RepID=UPI00093A3351|nr:AAA family ATPase [Exiguobacterium sp. AT1b]